MSHFLITFLKTQDAQIRSRFSASQLWTFLPSFPSIAFQNITIAVTDDGISLDVGLAFENPTLIGVSLKDIDVGLGLEGTNNVARVKVPHLKLERGLNEGIITVMVRFDETGVSVEDRNKAFAGAVRKIMSWAVSGSDETLTLAVTGPIDIHRAQFMRDITHLLKLNLPTREIFEAANIGRVTPLLTRQGLHKMMADMLPSLNASVSSDRIVAPVALSLPRLLPLPRINFPVQIAVEVHALGQHTMSVHVDPVVLITTENALNIATSVTVYPVNTNEAADALAGAINPILATQPTESTIDIKKIGILKPNSTTTNLTQNGTITFTPGSTFTWSDRLLKDATVTFPLPTICLDCIMTQVTSNGTSIPLGIPNLAVTQLSDTPGFGIQGSINVFYPQGFPAVMLNVGYMGVQVSVDEQVLLTAEMPNGIEFLPVRTRGVGLGPSETEVDVRAVLPPNDGALAPKVQSLVQYFMTRTEDARAALEKQQQQQQVPPV
ncbi:hypothetical protein HK102_008469, partial [Quaeritorhiza haematococci]